MIAATRPTREAAIAQTYDLLTRYDDDDHPPCCSNCGAEVDDTTTMKRCPDCGLDDSLTPEDE